MAEDTDNSSNSNNTAAISNNNDSVEPAAEVTAREKEIGGRGGPDPTRYGDWEKNGRCIDF